MESTIQLLLKAQMLNKTQGEERAPLRSKLFAAKSFPDHWFLGAVEAVLLLANC
jgi:hypothetical protein